MAYEYKGLGFSDEDIQSIENSILNGKLTTIITLKDGTTTITSAETALPESKGIPFIKGTQTIITSAFTGTTSEISTLTDGQAILYWLPYDSNSNATLNLTLSDGTTTGAKNCYFKGGSRLSTQYTAGSVILMTYRENVRIGSGSTTYTGWWCAADYDYSTTNATTLQYNTAIKCGTTAIASGKLIAGRDGVYSPINKGGKFDVTYPILYAGAAISAGSTGTNNYLARTFTVSSVQSGMTITTYKPLFIKGTLVGNEFTEAGNQSSLTQTVPTSEDGFDYLLLGIAGSTTIAYLLPNHPVFRYQGGKFAERSRVEATVSNAGLMSAADKAKLDGIAAEANKYVHPTYTTITGKPTANATPAFGGTFTVSQITTDTTGHVSGVTDRTITIPSTLASSETPGLVKVGNNLSISNGVLSGAYTSKTAASNGTDTSLVTTGEKYTWNNKQDKLVSGTNIKTINGTSLLGSGNIEIGGGGSAGVVVIDCGNITLNTSSSTLASGTFTEEQGTAIYNDHNAIIKFTDTTSMPVTPKMLFYPTDYVTGYSNERNYIYINKNFEMFILTTAISKTSSNVWLTKDWTITKKEASSGGGSTSTEPVEQETIFSGQYNNWSTGDGSPASLYLDTSSAGLTHAKIESFEFTFSLDNTSTSETETTVFQISVDDFYRMYQSGNHGMLILGGRFALGLASDFSLNYDKGTFNYAVTVEITPNWSELYSYNSVGVSTGFTYRGFKFANGNTY